VRHQWAIREREVPEPDTLTTEQWLAQHAVTWKSFQTTLLRNSEDIKPTLSATVKSAAVLNVVVTGPTRQDGAFDFKITFDAVASDEERAIRTLFVQSYSDLALPTRDVTALFLCNIIAVAEMLRLEEITATPRPTSSMGHLRAGFLPTQFSWDKLRAVMSARLRAEVVSSGEFGAISGLREVLDSADPRSIRKLLHDSGKPTQAGVSWPLASRALLRGAPAWSGRLDVADADTLSFRREFCRPYRG
jgi:hypothetical protein